MACQAFGSDSFASLTGDSPLPIIMHHGSTTDCLPTTSHAQSMVAAGKANVFSYLVKLVIIVFVVCFAKWKIVFCVCVCLIDLHYHHHVIKLNLCFRKMGHQRGLLESFKGRFGIVAFSTAMKLYMNKSWKGSFVTDYVCIEM